MHTANRMLVTTKGAARTRAFGRRLARLLRPGDVVLLQGPLGAGKTTLVQGVGSGLGVPGPVASPTFVYLVEYPRAGGGVVHHADLYRFTELAEEAREQTFESLGLAAAIVV